jgi:hypothetical protein
MFPVRWGLGLAAALRGPFSPPFHIASYGLSRTPLMAPLLALNLFSGRYILNMGIFCDRVLPDYPLPTFLAYTGTDAQGSVPSSPPVVFSPLSFRSFLFPLASCVISNPGLWDSLPHRPPARQSPFSLPTIQSPSSPPFSPPMGRETDIFSGISGSGAKKPHPSLHFHPARQAFKYPPPDLIIGPETLGPLIQPSIPTTTPEHTPPNTRITLPDFFYFLVGKAARRSFNPSPANHFSRSGQDPGV